MSNTGQLAAAGAYGGIRHRDHPVDRVDSRLRRHMYAVEDKVIQMVAVALATSVIALNLYLVYLFGYPFRGEMSVSERPFQIDIDIFDGVYDMAPAHDAEQLVSND